MIALGVLGGMGYLLQKPSDLQKAQQKRQDHQAKLESLKPLNARTGQPMTASSTGLALEASDLVPDVPLRGGYGDLYSPPYLNADWQVGSAITKPDRGRRQATLQEPPRPGAFLGLNDMSLGDDMRARTMMEPGQYQRDFNNFNGENGWQQGMTLVGRPNPQQAQIDARRVPITSLSKPSLGSIAIGPDERMPNPTSTLGVSFNVAARDGYNQIVRLPEKATAFENQMGAATPGGSGNANMRPETLNADPYLYTSVPKQNCYVDLGWTPAGDMGANGYWGDTIRGTEEQMVRKHDSILGRVGGKQAMVGFGVAPEAVSRAPLTKEVEARVPGGTFVDNPNQCDRIDMSMEGQHMSQVPIGKDVEHRETAAQNLPSYTGQGNLPFAQGQRQAQEMLIENTVGGVAGLELRAGTQLQNPVFQPPVYVNRF